MSVHHRIFFLVGMCFPSHIRHFRYLSLCGIGIISSWSLRWFYWVLVKFYRRYISWAMIWNPKVIASSFLNNDPPRRLLTSMLGTLIEISKRSTCMDIVSFLILQYHTLIFWCRSIKVSRPFPSVRITSVSRIFLDQTLDSIIIIISVVFQLNFVQLAVAISTENYSFSVSKDGISLQLVNECKIWLETTVCRCTDHHSLQPLPFVNLDFWRDLLS